MKNNTKIRLHLSKQLFESLAKQVLAEAKKGDMSGGAYTEAVKTPKEKRAPKSDNSFSAPKAESTDTPEVKEEAKSGLAKIMADIKSLPKAEKAKLHAALGKHFQEAAVPEVRTEKPEELKEGRKQRK